MSKERKNVLKNLSKLAIGAVVAVSMGACIWVINPDDDGDNLSGTHHGPHYDMWFSDVDVYCEYDAVSHWSDWTLVAEPDTTYGYDEIAEVRVDIAVAYTYTYTDSYRLTPNGTGAWSYSFQSYGWEGNSYYCGTSYDFEFIAYDHYDNYVSSWYYW